MKITLKRLILILAVLAAASLACNLPSSQTKQPPTAQPMNPQDMQNFEDQLKATLESPNAAGDVTITLTQQQLNSIIAAQMAKQSDQTITDPSVVLTGGHMEVYGKVNQSGISADLKLVLQPRVDANGNPRMDLISINLGGIPVPDVLKDRIANAADDALSSYLAENSNGFKVKTIAITEGQMTITGTPQR